MESSKKYSYCRFNNIRSVPLENYELVLEKECLVYQKLVDMKAHWLKLLSDHCNLVLILKDMN